MISKIIGIGLAISLTSVVSAAQLNLDLGERQADRNEITVSGLETRGSILFGLNPNLSLGGFAGVTRFDEIKYGETSFDSQVSLYELGPSIRVTIPLTRNTSLFAQGNYILTSRGQLSSGTGSLPLANLTEIEFETKGLRIDLGANYAISSNFALALNYTSGQEKLVTRTKQDVLIGAFRMTQVESQRTDDFNSSRLALGFSLKL